LPDKFMNIKETFTFDDVLLLPRRSRVFSRKDVSLNTQFSRHISLGIPIVSANMDTVTESRMARFMAESGGLGIIHRFLTIERQSEEVRKVKRAENVVIEDPYTISKEKTVEEAAKFMSEYGVSGLPVLDEKNKVVGIITKKDIIFTENKNKKVWEAMTKKIIFASPKISQEQARKILFEHRIEKLPLISSSGILKGLITLKDILRKYAPHIASHDTRGRLLVGAAVGVKEDTLDRARALLDEGADVLVLDIAHGHNERALKMIKILKRKFPGVEIVGGNVATPQGTLDLIKAGADAVKIGIGPGAACITRIVTGVGVPQLTAVLETSTIAKKYNIPLIADGGIRNSGDFCKALAAGAQSAMIGSLLAGCEESPGEYILEDGISFKLYRGMASRDASKEKIRLDGTPDDFLRAPEGKSGKVPFRGKTKTVLEDLIGGLRSSMSYVGAKNITEFQKNAEFIRITGAGLKESHSHDMNIK